MALRMLALFVMLSFSLFSGEIAGRVVRIADGDTLVPRRNRCGKAH